MSLGKKILGKKVTGKNVIRKKCLIILYDPPFAPPGDPNFEIRHDFIASKVEF